MTELAEIVAELKEINRSLSGWYDSQKNEWNEGIDSKLNNIDFKLEENVAAELVNIGRTLHEIGSAIENINTIGESKGNEAALSNLDEVKAQLEKTYRLCSTYGLVITIALIAILGTLRNWF